MITPSFGLTATERVLPKLALDFTTAVLDSRVTFTRTTGASNPATYVNNSGHITAAANNQPRFDYDPVTLVCKGLLIEESRINVASYSEAFDNAAWTKTALNTTGTPAWVDVAVSPANTTTAEKLIPDTNNTAHRLSRQFFPANLTRYSASVYLKAAEYSTATVQIQNAGAGNAFYRVTLTGSGSGVLTDGTTAANATASIRNVGNGWYRVSITWTTSNQGYAFIYVFPNTDSSFAGNGTDGVYCWGAQWELGAFPTSYIPTTTTALTRNADVATMTGTNFSDWFSAGVGGLVVRVLPSTISTIRPALQFDDNTTNEIISLRGNTSNPEFYIVDGGVAQAQIDAGTIAVNAAYTLGSAWGTNNCAAALNGGTAVTDVSATIPTVSQARLGSDGTNYLNGCLQNLRYWPQRIINAEVESFSK